MDCCLLLLDWLVVVHLVLNCRALKAPPPAEYRLFRDIFVDYEPIARPKMNASEPVIVRTSYYLNVVNHLDEKSQTITVVGWISQEWTDDLLRWDPSNYGGINVAVVPADRVWLPDVYYVDGVDKMLFEAKNHLPKVTSNGTVQYSPGGPVVLSCLFDLEKYPFDEQTCLIRISCWSNPEKQVILVAREFGLSNVADNGEWTITDTYLFDKASFDAGRNFSMVHFVLKLRRKALFHVLNILLPIVLLSLLNLIVFRLPSKSGEKVSLSITVLLAFSVWLMMLTDIMPNTSDRIPIVGVYIAMFMVISAVSVITTVYVIRVHNTKKYHPIPRWVHRVCDILHRPYWVSLNRNRVRDDSTASDSTNLRPSLTWKQLAATVDDIALYTLSSCIFILMTVVIGNFFFK